MNTQVLLADLLLVDDIEIKDQLLQEAQNGDSNSLDEKEATDSSLLKAASANSQMRFGYMYHCGKGVSVNYELAMEWYLKAHNNGNTDATNNIGYMYGHGQGVTTDAQLASKWYLEAADKGNACAQNNAGYSYENGIGIKRDVTIALEWYEKSAGQGFEKAKHNIVRLNKQGN